MEEGRVVGEATKTKGIAFGMALRALALYRERSHVFPVIQKVVWC